MRSKNDLCTENCGKYYYSAIASEILKRNILMRRKLGHIYFFANIANLQGMKYTFDIDLLFY